MDSRVCCLLLLALSHVFALEYRLEKHIVPVAYNIQIKPYLLDEDAEKQFTFDGQVNITLRALKSDLREITLHKADIAIENVSLYNNADQLVQLWTRNEPKYDITTEKLTLPVMQPLNANVNYVLHFNYTGNIGDKLAGLFRVSYTDAQGEKRWMGVTQMQRLNARMVFPCFDEPAMKATFELHINRHKTYNTVANTRLKSSEPDSTDRYIDHYEVTPKMSTYLVAFIVSEQKARGNSDFAVISHPEHYNYTEFSYNVGLKALNAFDQKFKLPYTELGNPILQHATTPEFPHNGMENWGLISYRQDVLVNEPGYSDGLSDKEFTIRIITHESSHMWFGDSVTFAWWSYFWLNEAFARYFEYFMSHELYPEYQLDQQFVVNQVHLIFDIDATANTQPMTSSEESIQTPTEIGWKFSSIAYAKGASIVRMLQNAMGMANFDQALHEYLAKFHLQNTAPADLFLYLKKHWPIEQNVDLDQFFYDWTEQVGFPMVFVDATEDRTAVILTQKRFLLNPKDGSDGQLRYTIPITYATNITPNFSNLTPVLYYNKTMDKLNLKFDSPIDWIVLNLKQINYHRVFYDASLRRQLQRALRVPGHSNIAVENRAQIIDDLFNFARVELLDYAQVIEFIEYLAEETEYLPWYAAFAGLKTVANRLKLEQLNDFAKFLHDISEKAFNKLGFKSDNDTVLDVYNRKKMIAWLCKYQHKDCNEQASAAVTELANGGKKPLPDLREILYCSGSRFGEYASVQKLFLQEQHQAERQKLWLGLSCTKQYEMHFKSAILNPATSELSKTAAIAKLYEENPENITPIFQLLTTNLQQLKEALGSWSTTANVICNLADYFTTEEQQQMLEDFITQNGTLFGDSLTQLKNKIKTVESNIKWAETHLKGVVAYLKKRNGATAPKLTVTILILMGLLLKCLD